MSCIKDIVVKKRGKALILRQFMSKCKVELDILKIDKCSGQSRIVTGEVSCED